MKTANERLILVTLNQSQWYPRKYDRKASEEIAQLHGAASAEAVGRFNKLLVEPSAIRPVQQAFTKLRNRHYAMTLPWSDDGHRVLPAELYFEYTQMFREAEIEINKVVDDFVFNHYERQRDAARVRLNGLFEDSDYPSAGKVRDRFGVRVKFSPLPNADDTRVWGIGDAAAAEIAEEVRKSESNAAFEAQKNVVDQVVGRAKEFIEKVDAYDRGDSKKLYETAVENLRDVVGLVMRGLNVTGDQELSKLASELQDAISDVNVDQLKHGEGLRGKKVHEVSQVLDRFEGVFGA